MADQSRLSSIKRAQKESVLFRLISELVHQAGLENKAITDLSVTRVLLSPGKSLCTVYFYTPQGEDHFNTVLDELKLYKPSIRKAIAQKLNARYTVELVFRFDDKFEKMQRIEQIFEKISEEEPSS